MWQVTAACLGVLVGVGCAQWANRFDAAWWLVLAMGIAVACIVVGQRWMLVGMVIAGGLLGLWRGSVAQHDITMYSNQFGQHVRLTGKVTEDPETNKRGELVLRLGAISDHGRSLGGELWVTASNHPGLQRSDRVVIDGKLTEGFGSFAASIKKATIISVQREQPGDIALVIRNDFSAHVEQAVHGASASLGIGYLLGEKQGLPEELVTALKVAGLTHIVVASGYNLTVLVRLARRLFEKVSKFLSMFTSALLIGGFMAVTGLSPSMTRAGLVSFLALWAWYYGRRFHPVCLLGLAGAITVLVNPSYEWGNLGWQLSFAAFAGVMIVAPLVHAYFFGEDKPHFVAQILIETIAAQIATLPIILFAFGQLSNVAPLANLLIVPAVPCAMLLVFVAGLGAYVLPQFATIIAWPAQIVLDAMIAIVNWCANLSWAQSTLQLQWWGVLLWYATLMGLCWYMWRVTKYRFHNSSIVE